MKTALLSPPWFVSSRTFVQTQVEAQALNLGANFQIIKLTYSATGGRVTFFNAAYI